MAHLSAIRSRRSTVDDAIKKDNTNERPAFHKPSARPAAVNTSGPTVNGGEEAAGGGFDPSALMFNYDEDFSSKPPKLPEPEEVLTWRSDPAKSLSDWTIKVTNKETRKAEKYYVHRNILAVGPRKSEYFVRYFHSYDRMSSSATLTDVWLEKVAAEVVPQLLDYMYSNEGKVNITTETAVGLRHVSQFFGVRPLHQKVMSFILEDFSMANLETYYKASVTVDDDKVSELAAKHCAQNIMAFDKDNSLLNGVDPHFFRRVMAAREIDSEEKKYHISLLLSAYCQRNKQLLDDQDFSRLTEERFLPVVHHSAALVLMETEADLILAHLPEESDEITSLQKRCIKDLTQHWEDFSKTKQATVTRVTRKLPSMVVGDLLIKSLAAARAAGGGSGSMESHPTPQSAAMSSDDKNQVMKVRKEYEGKMQRMQAEHQQVLDKLKKEYETSLLKLRDMILEKDKHLNNYWNDLQRFERLPNKHEGKFLVANDPPKNLPLPSIVQTTPQGIIWGRPGEGKFPVFYYKGE